MSLPDPSDQASHHELMDTASAVDAVRKEAAAFEQGAPGTCQQCGNYMPRVIKERGLIICCRCRDLNQR